MTDPVPQVRRPWFALLALAGGLLALAAVRPGAPADESAVGYRLLTTLGTVAAVASLAWRVHGLFPAAAAVVLLLVCDRPTESAAVLERGADAALIGLLALAVGAGTRSNDRSAKAWAVLALGVAALVAVGVCGWALPAAEDALARTRTRHLIVALTLLAGPVGCLGRSVTPPARLKLLLLWVGVPAGVVGTWRLATGAWPLTWDGEAWAGLGNEWSSAAWADAAWCWATPWAAVACLGLGLWRTAARGIKQLRAGDAPLAWLVGFAGLAAVVALTPRPIGPGSLALAAAGALLAVFGVADFGLSVIERIELKPPPPGPSDVPRVR